MVHRHRKYENKKYKTKGLDTIKKSSIIIEKSYNDLSFNERWY